MQAAEIGFNPIDDVMAVVRQDHLASRLSMVDPHAHLFATKSSRRLAAFTRSSEPNLVPLSLARYAFFCRRMTEAARTFRQLLVLGVGYDTRSLWLPALAGCSSVRIFEVDLPEKIEHRTETLKVAGTRFPAHVVPIGADLTDPLFPKSMLAAGFDPELPSMVLLEGVLFYLSPESVLALLTPSFLGLASGSSVAFDAWTNRRIERRNLSIAAVGASMRFGGFPLGDDPGAVSSTMEHLGYTNVMLEDLGALADEIFPGNQYRNAEWLVVSATVH